VFVSAEEAWEDVKENYFEGREDLAAAFQGDNPVANSAHYEIYLSDVSMQEVLVEYLEGMDDVRSVKQSEMVANTLSDFNRLIGYVSAGIILILLCVAVFLISNTVSVGISVRREEIAIMKLIGATDFLVRAPFVVEGMVIGLVGAFIPLALLYFLYGKIILYITEKFNFIGSILDFVAAEEIFRTLVPIAVILGIGIGFVGSFATVRKHLKI
jgi:cell division transport system permease protein